MLFSEIYGKYYQTVAAILREEMEGAVQYSVPLTAETGTGKTWYDAK